jgi:hypothetical protein
MPVAHRTDAANRDLGDIAFQIGIESGRPLVADRVIDELIDCCDQLAALTLNHERAEEERRGIVRWLRPEFQNPSGERQKEIEVEEDGDEQAVGEQSTGGASGTRGGRKKRKAKGQEPSPARRSQTRETVAASPGGRGGKVKKRAWPKGLAEQAAAVQGALVEMGGAASVDEVANPFLNSKKNKERVEELLDTLASLGKARELADGRFVAV